MEDNNEKNNQDIQEFDVTIPCWNSEITLGACLRGLLSSDIPIRKIFVIDQNSTDRTQDIARSYGAEIVTHSGKYTDAILLCAMSAETEYYINLESDVVVARNFFSKLKQHYRTNFISKGIVRNYMLKKYNNIAKVELDFYTRTNRPAGFACFIANRNQFISVFQKVIRPWKDIDAGSDTLTHLYCVENNIPCYQDNSIISTHLVLTLAKVWRSHIWYGRSVRKIPKIGEGRIIKMPPFFMETLIIYKDPLAFLYKLICAICWGWGWLTG